MTNLRMMGEKYGWWTGPEVERTPFYGMDTIFFSRLHAIRTDVVAPHVFICWCNPKFVSWPRRCDSSAVSPTEEVIIEFVADLIEAGKNVTIEVTPKQAVTPFITQLREKHLASALCILIALEIPQPDLGGYTVKVVPSHPFENAPNESCVRTLNYDAFNGSETCWDEYELDVDGDTEMP